MALLSRYGLFLFVAVYALNFSMFAPQWIARNLVFELRNRPVVLRVTGRAFSILEFRRQLIYVHGLMAR
jgi:hypothetical protein